MAIKDLMLAVGGGVAASVLDKKFADKAFKAGPVTLTAGTMAALGVTAAVMFKLPLPLKHVLVPLAGGALAWEGTKLANETLLPKLGIAGVGYDMRQFPGAYGGAALPPAFRANDYEIANALSAIRSM